MKGNSHYRLSISFHSSILLWCQIMNLNMYLLSVVDKLTGGASLERLLHGRGYACHKKGRQHISACYYCYCIMIIIIIFIFITITITIIIYYYYYYYHYHYYCNVFFFILFLAALLLVAAPERQGLAVCSRQPRPDILV